MTLNDILNIVRGGQTPYEFVTGGGIDFGLGAGRIVTVGGTAGFFLVKRSDSPTVYTLDYIGSGVGVGIGLPIPSGSASSPDWAGSGIGKIYRVPGTIGETNMNAFVGYCLIVELSQSFSLPFAGGIQGRALTAVFFGGRGLASTMPFALNPAFYRFAGLIWGEIVATPGAGVTAYRGMIRRFS